MKLHNKKTGEIIESEYMMCVQITSTKGERTLLFENLTQFNNDWEDYTPSEPLIKDEKIRKAVRAWAELHKIEIVFYISYVIHKELAYLKGKDTGVVVDIVALSELEDGETYTIAELCGVEEE